VSAELSQGEYRPTREQIESAPRLVDDEQGPLWYRDFGMHRNLAGLYRDPQGTSDPASEALLPMSAQDREAAEAAAAATAAAEAQALDTHINALLAHHEVDRIVVGHTPGFGTVVPRHGGRVLVIDSGIAPHYGGHIANLLIEGGRPFTNQDGTRVPLPARDASALEYFERIAELKPDLSNLAFLIDRLREQATAAGANPTSRQP